MLVEPIYTDGGITPNPSCVLATCRRAQIAEAIRRGIVSYVTPAPDVPPTVSIEAPSDGGTVSGEVTIRVAASDDRDPEGTLTVEIGIDGAAGLPAAYDNASGTYVLAWDTSGLDGLYSLRLSVVDHSTALRETTIQVTVDNISPTVDLSYPVEGAEYTLGYDEWANINAEVQDYSVDRVEFYEFAGGKSAEPPNLLPFAVRQVAPFNVNWTLDSSTGLGLHTFYVVAVDAAGNQAKSNLVTVQVVPRQEED